MIPVSARRASALRRTDGSKSLSSYSACSRPDLDPQSSAKADCPSDKNKLIPIKILEIQPIVIESFTICEQTDKVTHYFVSLSTILQFKKFYDFNFYSVFPEGILIIDQFLTKF